MNKEELEQKIQEKDLNAPRLLPADIKALVVKEQYYVFPGTQLTICCLTLKNGFGVIGESSCVSPENFNVAVGRDAAKEDAKEKIWMLEGYLLKQRLFERSLQSDEEPIEDLISRIESDPVKLAGEYMGLKAIITQLSSELDKAREDKKPE